MAATIAAAAATTSQIVPFGKCISSTIATAKPAATTTTPASTMPLRARCVLNRVSSSQARLQGSTHAFDVREIDHLRRYREEIGVGRPRAPREVLGREEHGRGHAERRGEVADP